VKFYRHFTHHIFT